MSDHNIDSAEGIEEATEIAYQYVENYGDKSWEKVTDAINNTSRWKIEFQLDGHAGTYSISVEKESGNICEIDL